MRTAQLEIETRAGELRDAAAECVAKAFPRLGDREDIAQEAYEALFKQAKAGARIPDPESQICTIAWRLANRRVRPDRSAVFKAAPVDPAGRTIGEIADESASTEEELFAAAERARAKAAVAELEPALAQIYYARHVEGLSTSEACEKLGLAKSTYCNRTNRLYRRVHNALSPAGIGELQLKAYEALQSERPSRLRAARSIARTTTSRCYCRRPCSRQAPMSRWSSASARGSPPSATASPRSAGRAARPRPRLLRRSRARAPVGARVPSPVAPWRRSPVRLAPKEWRSARAGSRPPPASARSWRRRSAPRTRTGARCLRRRPRRRSTPARLSRRGFRPRSSIRLSRRRKAQDRAAR
jgi:DNA-directed RNA polymerase specialized sigma24 family protein